MIKINTILVGPYFGLDAMFSYALVAKYRETFELPTPISWSYATFRDVYNLEGCLAEGVLPIGCDIGEDGPMSLAILRKLKLDKDTEYEWLIESVSKMKHETYISLINGFESDLWRLCTISHVTLLMRRTSVGDESGVLSFSEKAFRSLMLAGPLVDIRSRLPHNAFVTAIERWKSSECLAPKIKEWRHVWQIHGSTLEVTDLAEVLSIFDDYINKLIDTGFSTTGVYSTLQSFTLPYIAEIIEDSEGSDAVDDWIFPAFTHIFSDLFESNVKAPLIVKRLVGEGCVTTYNDVYQDPLRVAIVETYCGHVAKCIFASDTADVVIVRNKKGYISVGSSNESVCKLFPSLCNMLNKGDYALGDKRCPLQRWTCSEMIRNGPGQFHVPATVFTTEQVRDKLLTVIKDG